MAVTTNLFKSLLPLSSNLPNFDSLKRRSLVTSFVTYAAKKYFFGKKTEGLSNHKMVLRLRVDN
jgi:hypothetical protein